MRLSELKKEIIIGAISFLFGGVLSLFLENYLNRPQPEISVKDISFYNSSKEIMNLPESLIHFDDGLVRFRSTMDYQDILKQEGKIKIYLEASKILKTSLTEWLDKHFDPKSIDSSSNTITDFPAYDNSAYSNLFLHSVSQVDQNLIPISSSILQKMPSVFSVGLDSKENILTVTTSTGKKSIENFSPNTSSEVYLYNNLIYSIRTNTVINLFFYAEKCITDLNELIAKYQDILSNIENLLIENSRIKIKITIYNNGKDAVVIHPYFRLDVYNGKNIEEQYLMNTINYERDDMKFLNDYLQNFSSAMGEETGTEFHEKSNLESQYESFFKSKKTYPHLSIPGGQNITVELESTPNLSKKGIEIKKWFESGALFCKIRGLTVDDKKVVSPEIIFSATIQDQVKGKLGLK